MAFIDTISFRRASWRARCASIHIFPLSQTTMVTAGSDRHQPHRPTQTGSKPDTDHPMLIGYARVSTHEQNLDLQRDALKKAGCTKTFTDTISGGTAERPGLAEAFSHLREGDTLARISHGLGCIGVSERVKLVL